MPRVRIFFGSRVSAGAGTSVALTGLEATSAQGDLSHLHSNPLTGLEATSAGGTLTPATQTDVSAALTGLEATGALGTFVLDRLHPLAGQQADTALGDLAILRSHLLSGLEASGEQSSPTVARTHPITGLEATSARGDVTAALAVLLGGQGLTAAQSMPSVQLAALLGGLEATGAQGALQVNISAALASAIATLALGDFTVNITQTARPSSDISAGTWTPSTGADLFATIDEIVIDDADYDTSTNPVADVFEVRFESLQDPFLDSNHKVRYRLVGVDGPVDFTIKLVENATVRATWTHLDVTTATTFEQTLSGAEADSITDYGNLRLRFEASI